MQVTMIGVDLAKHVFHIRSAHSSVRPGSIVPDDIPLRPQAVRDDILDVANTMVSLEDRFVDLAFDLGPVEGMRPQDIKNYVRYICDWRLTQLRLPTIFGYFGTQDGTHQQRKPHPLPWIIEILNGVEHANFFEQRATEYSKGATRGSWEEVWNAVDARAYSAATDARP